MKFADFVNGVELEVKSTIRKFGNTEGAYDHAFKRVKRVFKSAKLKLTSNQVKLIVKRVWEVEENAR